MKTATNSLVLLAVLGAMLALAPIATPYNQQQVNGEGSGGPGLHWTSMPVTVVINSNGSRNVPLASVQNAIRATWATFEGMSTAAVRFHEDTNAADQARTDYNNGINLYYFDETGSTGLFGNSPSGAVAITPNSFQLNGDMIDASVIFNGRDYTFSTSGGNGTIDIQSVATHETEHLLGFDHTGDYTATLFPITFDNITRHPSPDDVAGISTVYPSGTYNATYGSITGHVQRAAGTAVQAAQVVALNLNGVVIETGYTDQNGDFSLKGLVTGGYTLYAEPVDGPMYNYNVSFNQVDTDFSATYLGGNASPQVVNVTAGQATAAGTITVRPSITINITNATPVTARQGQAASVVVVGNALDTANNGSIPGNGITITNITVLSSQQVQFDFTVGANAPLGARSIVLGLTSGDFEPITGAVYIEDASGSTLSYPGGGVAPPTITTSALPNGQVGVAYNQSLQGSGGTPPYTWSLSAGSLPAGLTLTANSGLISGTPTTVQTANFTAKLTDAGNISTTRALSIQVTAAALTITTANLPSGQVGQAYNQSLQATGGTAPYSWAITSGSLPTGLTMNGSGTISGTPSAAGTFNFTAQVSDSAGHNASRALSITISSAALTVTTSALPNGQVNVAYNQSLAASGGSTPYTWTITSGSLPTGLAMNASGTISGTPTAAGTYNFTAQVTDSAGQNASKALSITINPAAAAQSGGIVLGLGSSGGGYLQMRSYAAGSYASLGWLQAGWSAYNSASGETRVAMGDVDGDGKDDFVIGLASYTAAGGYVEVVSDAGQNFALLKWLHVPDNAYNSANGETWPAVGDVDGDGKAEVLVGQGQYSANGGRVWIFGDAGANFAYQGAILFPWSGYNSLNGETHPACGDLNGDGKAEVVIGQGTSGPNVQGGWAAVLGNASNGYAPQRWIQVPATPYNNANGLVRPACGDLNGSGKAQIVLGMGTYGAAGGNVWIFQSAAQNYAYARTLNVPWSSYNSANGSTRPAVGDIDGDGKADIVIGLGSGSIGWVNIFSDAASNYANLGWIQDGWSAYNSADGETWPAVGHFQ